jgi:hypothetical protein
MPQLGVIQSIVAQGLELMVRESAGSILGDGTVTSLTRERFGVPVDAFGIKWTHLIVPDGIGRRDRAVTVYEPATIQVAVIRTLLDGTDVLGSLVDSRTNDQLLFDSVLPSRVDVWVLPGVFMAMDWLLLL